jgi:hypothetical protein
MTKKSLLEWKRGHERAQERSWELRAAEPRSADESFRRANSLLLLTGDVVSSRFNEKARDQQTQIARSRWIALKKRYAARSA